MKTKPLIPCQISKTRRMNKIIPASEFQANKTLVTKTKVIKVTFDEKLNAFIAKAITGAMSDNTQPVLLLKDLMDLEFRALIGQLMPIDTSMSQIGFVKNSILEIVAPQGYGIESANGGTKITLTISSCCKSGHPEHHAPTGSPAFHPSDTM